jgi:hypothetical protein
MTRDPLEEDGALNLYGGILNSPILQIDALGKEHNLWSRVVSNLPPAELQKRTVNLSKGYCGGFSWTIQWLFSYPPASRGWIIQDITISIKIEDCNGNDISPSGFDYSEAWEVMIRGDISPNTDTFRLSEQAECTKGTAIFSGRAAFHPNLILPSSFYLTPSGRYHPAGGLRHTNHRLNLSAGTDSLAHRAVISWDCCSGRQQSQVQLE